MLRSDSEWARSGDLFSALFPDAQMSPPQDKGACGEQKAAAQVTEPWHEHPWLIDLWPSLMVRGRESGKQEATAPSAATPAAGEESVDECGDDSEFDAAAAFEELNSRRYLWDRSENIVCSDFTWKLRGGAWTAHGGVRDCIGCEAYGLVRSASFSINVYSEEEAAKLAVTRCELHQAWFNTWVEVGKADENYEFSAADFENCPKPAGFDLLCCSSNSKTRARSGALQGLRPRDLGAL